MQLFLCVSEYVSLKASFWLISESWCGLGDGKLCSNSCPLTASALGKLEALSVPVPATRRGLYPGFIMGVYPGCPSLLFCMEEPFVCGLKSLGMYGCCGESYGNVFVCVSVSECLQ